MTYKGPKIDATTKSRFEREASLGDGPESFEATDEILRRLGFEHVAVVRKQRETLRLASGGQLIEAALDRVERLGTFVELELSVDATDGEMTGVESAKQILAEVAARLQLVEVERRSYLELLLAAKGV
jgi:adenylate cyclase class 2